MGKTFPKEVGASTGICEVCARTARICLPSYTLLDQYTSNRIMHIYTVNVKERFTQGINENDEFNRASCHPIPTRPSVSM